MVATHQEKMFFSRSGICPGILNLDRENGNFEKSQRKVTMVRENLYFISKIFGEHQYSVISVQ